MAGSREDVSTDVDTRSLTGAGKRERPAMLARGASLGRFVVLEEMGGGATGTVYSAFDPVLDRQVAIKLLHGVYDGLEADERRTRVEREAQAMARVSHPNVVTIFDVGVSEEGRVFLAMEKVEGGTLSAWLRAEKRPWRDVVRVFCEAGEGLAAAHRAGVIHRDFKLDNVLLDREGHARVTDFGLARAAGLDPPRALGGHVDEAVLGSSRSFSEPLTRTGALLGTPGYMPPEQYTSAAIDERADIFAFSATLHRALYGERPFPGDTVEEIALSTLTGRVREPPRDSDVPAWVRRVVQHGLATERDRRPASMTEVLDALNADPQRRRRRWAMAGVVALAVVGAVAGARGAGARQERACRAAGDRLDGIWDRARKAAIESTFHASGRRYASDSWAQVERELDAYARTWSAASEEACRATRVRGEQSEPMLELRSACLEDRRGELRALVDVLASADGEVVRTSVRAARELSPLDACSDVDRLSASGRLPPDPALRDEIRALQSEVAVAKELFESGMHVPAAERLVAIGPRVEKTGYGPLQVEWSMRLAVAQKQSDEKASVIHYERAIELAEAHRLDEKKAAAEISLGSFEGSWLDRPAEAHTWMRLATATIERLGGNARLEALRDVEEAWVYQYEHKLALAEPLFRRALERIEKGHVDDPDMIASAHSGLAEALSGTDRPEDAMEQERMALQTMETLYGREHPLLSGFQNNLAVTQLAAGYVDAALATALHALATLDGQGARGEIDADAPEVGLAAHTMGEVLFRARRPADAVESFERARRIYRAAHGDDHADVAYADFELADAYRAVGRPLDAGRALDEAEAIEAKIRGVPANVVAGTLAARARLLLDRGDAAGALEKAEKALALARNGDAAAWDVARVELVVAEALQSVKGPAHDAERARTLATHARETFARSHDDDRRDESAVTLRALE